MRGNGSRQGLLVFEALPHFLLRLRGVILEPEMGRVWRLNYFTSFK
jgi:hypothetical protein